MISSEAKYISQVSPITPITSAAQVQHRQTTSDSSKKTSTSTTVADGGDDEADMFNDERSSLKVDLTDLTELQDRANE